MTEPTIEKKEEQQDLNLPRCENTTFSFKADTKMFWIGIPVDKTEPFVAACVMDNMKLNYIQAFAKVMHDKQSKIEVQQPGVLNRIRDNFLRNTKKV
jgi:hypothetical protein